MAFADLAWGWLVFGAIDVVFMLVVFALMIHRRKHFLLVPRQMKFSLFAYFNGIIGVSILSVFLAFPRGEFDERILVFSMAILVPNWGVPFMIRCFVLIVNSSYNLRKVDIWRNNKLQMSLTQRLAKSQLLQLLFLLVVNVAHVAAIVAIALTKDPSTSWVDAFVYYDVGVWLVYFLVFSWQVYLIIFSVKDPYYERFDSLMSVASLFILVGSVLVLIFGWYEYNYYRFYLLFFIFNMGSHWGNTFVCFFSFRSVRNFWFKNVDRRKNVVIAEPNRMFVGKKKTESQYFMNSPSSNLAEVLDNPDVLSKFENYLISHWAVENLLFYVQVNLFKEVNEEANQKEAQAIYDQYISPSAPLPINVDYKVASETRKMFMGSITFGSYPKTVFEGCQQQIFHNLQNSFMDYQRQQMQGSA
eukprot:Lithocolla_globosa_v1_NODE_3631_length_1620_cov_18.249201.p1 type:complete len:415 gc:universal NODE_3631_length_1620_cov_18.249201:179-1423(+)